jgi:hypothetical protein
MFTYGKCFAFMHVTPRRWMASPTAMWKNLVAVGLRTPLKAAALCRFVRPACTFQLLKRSSSPHVKSFLTFFCFVCIHCVHAGVENQNQIVCQLELSLFRATRSHLFLIPELDRFELAFVFRRPYWQSLELRAFAFANATSQRQQTS